MLRRARGLGRRLVGQRGREGGEPLPVVREHVLLHLVRVRVGVGVRVRVRVRVRVSIRVTVRV